MERGGLRRGGNSSPDSKTSIFAIASSPRVALGSRFADASVTRRSGVDEPSKESSDVTPRFRRKQRNVGYVGAPEPVPADLLIPSSPKGWSKMVSGLRRQSQRTDLTRVVGSRQVTSVT